MRAVLLAEGHLTRLEVEHLPAGDVWRATCRCGATFGTDHVGTGAQARARADADDHDLTEGRALLARAFLAGPVAGTSTAPPAAGRPLSTEPR